MKDLWKNHSKVAELEAKGAACAGDDILKQLKTKSKLAEKSNHK